MPKLLKRQGVGVMRENPANPTHVLVWAAGSLLIYFLVTEFILCWPAIQTGSPFVRLDNGDTIALLTGSVTAAGLAALYVQFRESVRVTRASADADRKAAATQVDNLHVAFNQREMRRSRDLGWRYLDHLKVHPDQIELFAASWVLSRGKTSVPDAEKERSAPSYGIEDFSHYNWAISSMVAFFVRLEAHLAMHAEHLTSGDVKPATIAGPFFWNYWRGGLLDIAEACDNVYNQAVKERIAADKDPHAPVRPYFSDPLWRLEKLLTTVPRERKIEPIKLDDSAINA